MRYIICLFFITSIPSTGQAELYKYTDLMFKGYRELYKEISAKLDRANVSLDAFVQNENPAEIEQAKVEALRDSLMFIFSRPDRDSLSQQLLPKIKNPLKHLAIYEETLYSLSREAVLIYKNKKLSNVHRATAMFILENIMAEARPNINQNAYIKKIFVSIRDSQLNVPSKVKLFRLNRGMFKSRNPSDVARSILKSSKN